jgi:pSer/pThr/pTyr-binding forkhead associated (FHA) protein
VLRERGGEGREFPLGEEPAVIGASDAASTIVLAGDGIAQEHARIWLRQQRYLLHHVGGLSRKTYVGGQEADWVVLESGDEVTIGAHRLVFEDLRFSQRELQPPAAEQAVGRREQSFDDDLSRMEAAVRELWADALPASETAVGERSGTGKYKVHRRKDELAQRVGGTWVKRGRTVVLER